MMIIVTVMSFYIQAANSIVKCAVVVNFEVNLFNSVARNQRAYYILYIILYILYIILYVLYVIYYILYIILYILYIILYI